MQCPKRPSEDQDPDYPDLQPSDTKRQKLAIDRARDETCLKIRKIINSQFEFEMKKREEELFECQDRLNKARQNLRLLRYAVVSSYYRAQPSKEQSRIHPAVKKLLGTKKHEDFVIDMEVPESLSAASTHVQPIAVDSEKKATQIMLSKQPRYIAPLDKPGTVTKSPPRASNLKVKKRIVVGNVSKWIHADFRDDASTHKWMIYVRGPPDAPDVSDFVERVRFFLHSSYKPHDVIEIKEPPFHLSRRGWGEFPVRVQIHFTNPQNRPIDVIHQLVLDKTYTGLQTLGGETIVEAWVVEGSSAILDRKVEALNNNQAASPEKMCSALEGNNVVIKEEPVSPPPAPRVSPGKSLLKKPVHAQVVNGANRVLLKSFEQIKSTEGSEQKVFKLLVGPGGQLLGSSAGQKIIIRPKVVQSKSCEITPKNLLTFGSKNVLQLQRNIAPKILKPADGSLLTTNTIFKTVMAGGRGTTKPLVFLTMNKDGKLVPMLAPGGQPKVIKINSASPPPLVLIKKTPPKIGANGIVPASQAFKLMDVKPELKIISLPKKKFEQDFEQLKVKQVDNYDTAALLLMRRLPLFNSELSNNEDYRVLHPYVVGSRERFLQLHMGKQRALEIKRAKEIASLLKAQGFQVENPWDLVRMSRDLGFTPISKSYCIPRPLKSSANCGARYSEAHPIYDWLGSKSNEPREPQESVVVDVEGHLSPGKKVSDLTEQSDLKLDETLAEEVQNCDYVRRVSKQIGVTLEPEKLTETSTYRSAETVLYQAALQLMEEILRRSYCESLRTQNTNSIELKDVRAALQQRPELDVFSNEGLGLDMDK